MMKHEPLLAVPTEQQLHWQDMELGMFCHFGINTFCDQEWGDGSDSPERFLPTALDAVQWVRTAKRAGFRYFILTAKHHDGFCLWPTRTTDYSVKSSPWLDGKGDVVRACAEACRSEGLGFGIYVSPWDRNAACYRDRAAYDDFYAEQLTELLTQYGPLVEVWFDGTGRRCAVSVLEHGRDGPDQHVYRGGRELAAGDAGLAAGRVRCADPQESLVLASGRRSSPAEPGGAHGRVFPKKSIGRATHQNFIRNN